MRKVLCVSLLMVLRALGLSAAQAPNTKMLTVYFIDTEGAKAELIVTSSGQSMLIDAGWPGLTDEKFRITQLSDRDSDRILEAVKAAGIKGIDYLVVTHYDLDHVGNVPRFVAKLGMQGMSVGTFVDHGPLMAPDNTRKDQIALYEPYAAIRDKGKHIVAKPGETIPMNDLKVQVVTSAEQLPTTPFPGGGKPNDFCAGAERKPLEHGENPGAVGLLLTYGSFRMIDLGDFLGAGQEYALMCPNNPVGTVDLFVSSAHGWQGTNTPVLVHALHPRVVIENNGVRKGGDPVVYKTYRSSPGIEDVWQLHYSIPAGTDANPPEQFIANQSEENCQGKWIKMTVQLDGTFTLTNARTGFSKTYKRKS